MPIEPIEDEYIDEIIKGEPSAPANPTKTQGFKLRELVKKLRDQIEAVSGNAGQMTLLSLSELKQHAGTDNAIAVLSIEGGLGNSYAEIFVWDELSEDLPDDVNVVSVENIDVGRWKRINLGGQAVDLQSITDSGNSTTNDIILEGSRIVFESGIIGQELDNGLGDGLTSFHIDNFGNLYLLDLAGGLVIRYEDGDFQGTFAGGNGEGSGLNQLTAPREIGSNNTDNSVLIVDSGNNRIISKYNDDPEEVLFTWTTGTGSAQLGSNISGICSDYDGNIYLSDSDNNRVMKWNSTDGLSVILGGNGEGDNLNQLSNPQQVTVDNNGYLNVADLGNHRIIKCNPFSTANDEVEVVAGGNGFGNGLNQLDSPKGVTINPDDYSILVADTMNNRIMRFSNGDSDGEVIVGINGNLDQPAKIEFRGDELYILDSQNFRLLLYRINSNGSGELTYQVDGFYYNGDKLLTGNDLPETMTSAGTDGDLQIKSGDGLDYAPLKYTGNEYRSSQPYVLATITTTDKSQSTSGTAQGVNSHPVTIKTGNGQGVTHTGSPSGQSVGGDAGLLKFQTGNGGHSLSSVSQYLGSGGQGGDLQFVTGSGGAASTANGFYGTSGGNGGSFNITTGNGGNAAETGNPARPVPGNGGDLVITLGTAGTAPVNVGRNGRIVITNAPEVSETNHHILVRDNTTGAIEIINSVGGESAETTTSILQKIGNGASIDPQYLPAGSDLVGSKTLAVFHNDAENTGTGNTPLYNYTLPANTLSADGQTLEISYSGTIIGGLNNGDYDMSFSINSDAIGNLWPNSGTGGNSSVTFEFKILLIRTSSTKVKVTLTARHENSTTITRIIQMPLGDLDFTTSNDITLSGQSLNTGDIVAKMGKIQWYAAP